MTSNKKTRACDTCRKKKIKCDIAEQESGNCSNCSKGNRRCSFDAPAPPRAPPRGYVHALENRISSLEALVADKLPHLDIRKEIEREKLGPSPTASNHKVSTHDVEDSELDSADELENKMKCLYTAPLHPYLKRYYGRSSGNLLLTTSFLYGNANPNTTPSLTNITRDKVWQEEAAVVTDKRDENTAAIKTQDFPSEVHLNDLVELYFDKVNKYLPLLHKSTFTNNISKRKYDSDFAGVLFLVCAIACRHSTQYNHHTIPGDIYYKLYKKKCRKSIMTAPSLEDIQALILLQIFIQDTPYMKTLWTISAETLQLCIDVGYHRRQPTSDKLFNELRFRAFYCSHNQHVTAAAIFGKPVMLHDVDFDAKQPSSLLDEIGTDAEMSMCYLNHYSSLYQILARILIKMYPTKHAQPTPEEKVLNTTIVVAQLSSDLSAWNQNLNPRLRYNSDTPANSVYASYLRIAYFMVQIFIYRNFITMPRRRNNNTATTSLSIAISASTSIVQIWRQLQARGAGSEYCDSIVAFSLGTVIPVLTIGACETRKYSGDSDGSLEHLPELKYIRSGVRILHEKETTSYTAGKLNDILSNLLNQCRLPIQSMSVSDSDSTPSLIHNTDLGSSDESMQLTPPEQSQTFYLDIIGAINSTSEFDGTMASSSNDVFNIDDLLQPKNDDNWSEFISSLGF